MFSAGVFFFIQSTRAFHVPVTTLYRVWRTTLIAHHFDKDSGSRCENVHVARFDPRDEYLVLFVSGRLSNVQKKSRAVQRSMYSIISLYCSLSFAYTLGLKSFTTTPLVEQNIC